MSKSTNLSESLVDEVYNPFNSIKKDEILEKPRVSKHGLTTAGLDEQPLDMLSAILHEKKIQEEDKLVHGEPGELHFFMATTFESLNMGRDKAEEFLTTENESRSEREDYLAASADIAGLEEVNFVRSEEVFKDEEFYNIADRIVAEAVDKPIFEEFESSYPCLNTVKRDVESILPQGVIDNGMAARDALELFEEVYSVDINDSLYDASIQFEEETGEEMKAAHWYGIFEIAATEWMRREQGINNKSGHDKENIYDKKINKLISTSRYNQPASLGSQVENAGTRIPYTVWPGREDSRLLLSDSREEISEKMDNAKTNFAVTTTDGLPGYIWNPVLEKGFVAAEILSENGEGLKVDNKVLESAEDVLDYCISSELDSYGIESVADATLEDQYSNQEVVSEAIDQNAVGKLKNTLPKAYDKITCEIIQEMDSKQLKR